MRPITRAAVALLAVAMAAAGAVAADPAAAAPPPTADQSVIVVMSNAPTAKAGSALRSNAVASSQLSINAELAGAKDVHRLNVVDAVSAKVTPQQEARLRADPNVAEVVPDAAIKVVPPTKATPAAGAGTDQGQLPPGACAPNGGVQLDPEALSAINADSDVPGAKTARGLGATGAGVTIGDIAGSIDVNSPELIRPDGSHVISDYQDFTGEGSTIQSEDIESFLDDGAIAAQGRGVYDLADYTVHHLSQPCRIKLEGIAPQVNLTAYKVYAANDMTTTSAFLQALDYAVDVDHVNVLNEEAGSFPMPDTSADLIKTANANAMAAGVTITVPSYDSGLTNTIWSPASQPGVISVGASTTFRSYSQSDEAGFWGIGATGWVSDNISSLSSGGSTEQGRSIDVVAPGDLDWTICTDNPQAAADCLNNAGKQTGVKLEGGTSEAGPIVAGVAALVIQSYRDTHGGASPSPAQVDSLITGTADDLDVPAAQQGAGRVDAYRAVAAARAMSGVVADTDQLDAVGNPGSAKQFDVTLTNAGANTAHVDLSGHTLGATHVVDDASPNLTLSDPSYVNSRGLTHNYLKVPFTVPPGQSRLNADIAWPATNGGVVDVTVLDPQGKVEGYSLPEGSGNHGHADVRDPEPGQWTAVISAAEPGYTGVVHFEASVSSDVFFGSASPSSVTIAPGKSAKVSYTVSLPNQPGDLSASLGFAMPGSPASSIPLTLRSLVADGHFTADLRGGNGRAGTPSQTFFYNVDVPAG
ncbi:MAG TPA: S8 family serine peptidase, partial [Pseudonocardiaceae bacterium]